MGKISAAAPGDIQLRADTLQAVDRRSGFSNNNHFLSNAK